MQSFFTPISDFLFRILEFVHNLGISWGWSIVVLTVIVRIVLIPLTWRQFKSMRALQALQPQVKALQEKYKNDRQLLTQKTTEFYRENKVNPFGSCLPLLLQMPVFFALFYMLRAQEQTTFVGETWLWIRDWGAGQPSWVASDITEFDMLLLLLYVASQFLSSLMMTTSQDPTQRAMMYIMPIGIGFIMYLGKWPAGLFIYWFTSNLWTIAQQYIIMKTMPPPVLEPAPAASSGGTSGSSTQRKKSKQQKGGKR